MRVVGEIPHSECKITIFHWNNRYLIKLEQGPFEQTFKIQEYDLGSEEEVRQVVSEQFIQSALRRFEAMAQSLGEAMSGV
jgi:predicted secreted protein